MAAHTRGDWAADTFQREGTMQPLSPLPEVTQHVPPFHEAKQPDSTPFETALPWGRESVPKHQDNAAAAAEREVAVAAAEYQ